MQMMVSGIHGQGKTGRRVEGLPGHRLAHFIDIGGARFGHRLRPHMQTHPGRFHRIVGYHRIGIRQLVRFGIRAIIGDKGFVGRIIDGLKVVPCREVADQRFGIDAAQLLFPHREGHHRYIGRFQTLVSQLFVERYVGIAINGGDHCRFATGGEFFDIGDDGLVIAVAERGVDLLDIFVLDPFGMQEGAEDLVGGARIDVVRPQQKETFSAAAVLAQQVFHRRDSLLVRRRAGIEDVGGHLFPFVLHRVEQQAVQFLKHRQDRFTRDRRPAAKHHRHFILGQQLARLLGKQRPVGGRVDHHRLQFLAQHPAFGVDVVDGHQRDVFQRRFGNRHRPGERMHDPDFDGVGGIGLEGETHSHNRGGECKSF